jgi:phage repressor protein C with HTH and peptisase S24 domain
MFTPAQIYDLIEERRRELGISQADLGLRAFGKADNTAVQSIRKGSAPSVERLAAIAEALNLEFYLGKRRDFVQAPTTVLEGERFETVARFDAAGSAGNGALNLDGPPIDHLAFSKRWLAQNGISAGASFLINVIGDSMEPSLYDGDLVMIDRRKTRVRSGRIYAFREGDCLRIKRLELIPGTALILRSDNPRHAAEHLTGNSMNTIEVLGEVVWSGHTWV